MGRVINPDSAGKERAQLSKAAVLAVRELARQEEIGDEARDLAAFLALALLGMAETIEPTVAAWEKRGYWVKADRFRMEWAWAGSLGIQVRQALLGEDWPLLARLSVTVAGKLAKVRVTDNHRLGRPWMGAYRKVQSGQGD